MPVRHQTSDTPARKMEEIAQERLTGAPAGWAVIQDSLALKYGISLLLVNGHQPPALAISNNNSICHVLQSSPEFVKLCDPFCGQAYERAAAAGAVTRYRCHAGLDCFAAPIQLGAA